MSSTDTRVNVTPGAWTAQRVNWRGARAWALCCASLYLVLAALVFVARADLALAAFNVALTGVLVWSLGASSRRDQAIGDFLTVMVATAVAYGEVPALVTALGSAYRDSLIQSWELALFGTQPSRTFAGAFPSLWISELLHGGYMAFYLATFIPPLLLFARDEREGFAETILTMAVTWTVCCAFFAFFPVQGPRYLWPTPAGLAVGPLRRLSVAILQTGSARGAAFPSLHMAASVSQTFMAWRWQPRPIAWAVTTVTVLVGFGAVYAGYHYAVDMLAGAATGASVGCLVCLTRTSSTGDSEPQETVA